MVIDKAKFRKTLKLHLGKLERVEAQLAALSNTRAEIMLAAEKDGLDIAALTMLASDLREDHHVLREKRELRDLYALELTRLPAIKAL